jgi:hypothetical protein
MIGALVIIVAMLVSVTWAGSGYRGPFGFDSVPSAEEIQRVDIAVGPDGAGLPPVKAQ